MLKKLILGMLCLFLTGVGFGELSLLHAGEIQYKPEIASYVAFLKAQNQNPVDYVLGLYEKYDLVIYCERAHPEKTQYDFIQALISDKRFIDKVGNIFTECGTSSNNDFIHAFLSSNGLKENEVDSRLLSIYRHFSHLPFWEKHTYYDFLKRLYMLNKTLPANLKINLYMSDMPFSWDGMTKEKYTEFNKLIGKRDWVMADQIIKKFNEIKLSRQPRKKALVIMNYRHAFNYFKYADGTTGDNTGRYIFEAFPGQVANIMINTNVNIVDPNSNKSARHPVNNGKWDAAFEVVGNLPIGFDFKGSPFGTNYFDYFTYEKHNATYQDVFTGYIFYEPLKNHRLIYGIPKLFADGFDKIILKRQAMAGYPVAPEKANEFIMKYETQVEEQYPNIDDMINEIDQWLLPVKTH